VFKVWWGAWEFGIYLEIEARATRQISFILCEMGPFFKCHNKIDPVGARHDWRKI
jgi:hypothetical protein